jgi:hypothetical protein
VLCDTNDKAEEWQTSIYSTLGRGQETRASNIWALKRSQVFFFLADSVDTHSGSKGRSLQVQNRPW